MARTKRRRGRRIRTRHPAFFQMAEQAGTGTLIEVSYTGGRVKTDASPVTRGDAVQLYVWPSHEHEPVELPGRVATVAPDGFAVEFGGVGQELCQWVDTLETAADPADVREEEAEGARGQHRSREHHELHLEAAPRSEPRDGSGCATLPDPPGGG
jgi:hypothetical protein